MGLKFEKMVQDKRGKIFFFSNGNKKINFLELKNGFSRGGHYHEFDSTHIILSGIIKYYQEDICTKKETISIVDSPRIIITPCKNAHLITALTDTVFAEVFDQDYSAVDYLKYRSIVKNSMNVRKR